jgi:anti-sigma regulatory factor (Ser/Thr protein kinase)
MRGRVHSAAARKPVKSGGRKPKAKAHRAGASRSVSVGAAPRVADRIAFHAGKAPVRGETVIALALPGDLNLKYAYLLRIIGAVLTRLPLSAEEEGRLQACLDEGLQNAIIWGCAGDPGKTVAVRAWIEGDAWGLTIADPGKGFTRQALPDYEAEDFPLLERGRGILRLLHLASEVTYFDGGRTLLLRR